MGLINSAKPLLALLIDPYKTGDNLKNNDQIRKYILTFEDIYLSFLAHI